MILNFIIPGTKTFLPISTLERKEAHQIHSKYFIHLTSYIYNIKQLSMGDIFVSYDINPRVLK